MNEFDSIKNIWDTIANASRVILVINVLLLAVLYRRLNTAVQAIVFFMVIDMFTEVILFFKNPEENNMPLLHGYTLASFLAVSWFYKVMFAELASFQKYFWWFVGCIVLLLLLNSRFLEPVLTFNSNAQTLVKLIIIGYAITWFFLNFGKLDFTQTANFVKAMINSGLLVYHSGSLFVFMFAKILSNSQNAIPYSKQVAFWVFNSCLYLIFELVILVVIWRSWRGKVLAGN